jgi:predicted phage tail protein
LISTFRRVLIHEEGDDMKYNITAVNNNKDLRVSILDNGVEVDSCEFRTAGAAYDFVGPTVAARPAKGAGTKERRKGS